MQKIDTKSAQLHPTSKHRASKSFELPDHSGGLGFVALFSDSLLEKHYLDSASLKASDEGVILVEKNDRLESGPVESRRQIE
jgi:hypothetical protein